MITSFKIFENNTISKFKVGDYVYFTPEDNNTLLKDKKFKIVRKIEANNSYILDKFLNFPVPERRLISEYEYNANNYNL